MGDRVVTVGLDGSHAELRAVPTPFAWLVPPGCPPTKPPACRCRSARLTIVCSSSGDSRPVRPCSSTPGASGVGIAAVQLASRAGARVLATASSDDKLARLAPLGLDHGINYAADRLRRGGPQSSPTGRGADVIVDSVGGPTLQGSLRCLAYRGRCVTVGDAGRHAGETPRRLDVAPQQPEPDGLLPRGRAVPEPPPPRHDRPPSRAEIAAGRLSVVIDRRFPLSEAEQAHAYIESRKAFGRVLLVP